MGSIPKDLAKKYPYYKSCKVNALESKWGCNSTRIKLGNLDYINSDYSYFQSNVREIKVPKKFHTYFLLTLSSFWSKYMLEKMGKKITLDDVRRTVKTFKDAKIRIYNYFVIGLPWESEETVEETIRFAIA